MLAPAVRISILGLLGAACVTRAADSQPPVPVHRPDPLAPVETAATGIAPEVTAELDVDAAGRVTGVRIVGIEPSTEYDEQFRAETSATLRQWRFEPAVRDGAPAGATWRQTVRFRPYEARTRAEEVRRGVRRLLHEDAADAVLRRWAVVAMPLDRRVELLGALARLADRHLDAERRRVATTEHFRVITDSPHRGVAETLARNLEAGFAIVNGLLSPTVQAQPGYGKVLAYLFSSRDDYLAFSRAASRQGYEWSAGFYAPEGLIAFHTEMATKEHLREVMLHETTHAFLDRHVVRPGGRLPAWLDEGLADYVGNSLRRRKRLIPGKHRRHQVYHAPDGMVVRESIPQMEAEQLRRAIREGRAVPLADLVAAERDAFYGEQRSMFYPQSWLLVHFLRHGGEDWAEDRFPRFVLYVAEGYPADEAMRTVWGRTPQQLEPDFREYVDEF